MKKVFLFVWFALAVQTAPAACPKGYTQIDGSNVWVIAKSTCPKGYTMIASLNTYLPSGGVCDTTKGSCSAAGVCQVP